jgi:hypothetical protein
MLVGAVVAAIVQAAAPRVELVVVALVKQVVVV